MKVIKFSFALLMFAMVSCTRQQCRRGHLTVDNSCKLKQSSVFMFGMGWDSHFATGKVDKSFCEPIKTTTDRGKLQGFGSVTTQFRKIPCESYLPAFQGVCIFGQKGSEVAIVAVDDACDNGVFFNGRNRTLSNGDVVPL